MPPKRGRGGTRTASRRDSTRRESLSSYFDNHTSNHSHLTSSSVPNELSLLPSEQSLLSHTETRERNTRYNRREERERTRPSVLRYQSRVDNSMLHRPSTLVHNNNTNSHIYNYHHRNSQHNRSNYNINTSLHTSSSSSRAVTDNHRRAVSNTVSSSETHDECNSNSSGTDVKTGSNFSDTLQAVRAHILSSLSMYKDQEHARIVCKEEEEEEDEEVINSRESNAKCVKKCTSRQRNSVSSKKSYDENDIDSKNDEEENTNKCDEHHIRALRIAFGDKFATLYETKLRRNLACKKTKADKYKCKKDSKSRLLESNSSLSSSFSSSSSSSSCSSSTTTTNDSPSSSPKKSSSSLSQEQLEEEKLKQVEDELQELCVSSVEFSLICPYSRLPMTYPVRSRQCNHVQCCDLDSWIALLDKYRALRDPKGPCPVCEQRVCASSLEIDQWMLLVIEQMPPSTHLVVMHNDGTVESADIARERKKQAMMMEVIDATQYVCNSDDNTSDNDDEYDNVIDIMEEEEEEELEHNKEENTNINLHKIIINDNVTTVCNSESHVNVDIHKESVNVMMNENATVPVSQTGEHTACTDSVNMSTLDTMQSAKSTCATLEHGTIEEMKSTDLAYASNVKREVEGVINGCEIHVDSNHISTHEEENVVLGESNSAHDKEVEAPIRQELLTTQSEWLPPVVIVRYEESHSTRVLPSQLRKWVPYCPQCKARLKKDEFDCWCGCAQCNKLHVDEWTYVRKFRPVTDADSTSSLLFKHHVMMELTADGTTILRNVDVAAAYLFRAGFQRSDMYNQELQHWPPSVLCNSSSSSSSSSLEIMQHNESVWVSTFAFSRVELDFLEACCERVANHALDLDFDGNAVPLLFRIPHRRKAARREANTHTYNTNTQESNEAHDAYRRRRKDNFTQSSHNSEISLPSSVPSSQTCYHSYAPTFTSSAVLCASNGMSPAVELTFPCEAESRLH